MSLSPYIHDISQKLKHLQAMPSLEGALDVAQNLAHMLHGNTSASVKILNVVRHGRKIEGWFHNAPGLDFPATYEIP